MHSRLRGDRYCVGVAPLSTSNSELHVSFRTVEATLKLPSGVGQRARGPLLVGRGAPISGSLAANRSPRCGDVIGGLLHVLLSASDSLLREYSRCLTLRAIALISAGLIGLAIGEQSIAGEAAIATKGKTLAPSPAVGAATVESKRVYLASLTLVSLAMTLLLRFCRHMLRGREGRGGFLQARSRGGGPFPPPLLRSKNIDFEIKQK